MRSHFATVFILLLGLIAFQAKSQYIYFTPAEISTSCHDSSTIHMQVEFKYSDSISLCRNANGSHFLVFHSNNSFSSCQILRHQEYASIDTLDITGDGFPELLLVFESRSGHSGWQGGLSESYRHLQIYDIKNKHLILNEDVKMRLETWDNELEEPDSLNSGNEPTITESYTDIDCYEMEYAISNGIITFKPIPESEDCPSSDEIQPYSLKWTDKGFIEL